ncbi:ankyrin repeat domain-containing protein [Pseudomonas capeferrum]|uniref:ankyrin repeat domain-containing protein n=1 Tax=Pseudomonas capeferrum TaxID=1495066 RepID=UPI0015E2B20E|nr:ankyrin repeat domain-containing protein [Pseudomonas capeferrum]MBA1200342.1 ankyrin repeat domain-containing protein [Pseudomonas capeferrum]
MLLAGTCQAVEPTADQDPALLKQRLQALLLDAAREGRTDVLSTFIEAGYDLETRDSRGYSALILAAYHDQEDAVTQLIAAGADPCGQDNRGNTAMMGAIFKGNLAIAKRLLEADCSPDQRNHSGQTAAMYAALFQRQDILDALASKGADLTLKDAAGNDVGQLSQGRFGSDPKVLEAKATSTSPRSE